MIDIGSVSTGIFEFKILSDSSGLVLAQFTLP